MLDAILRFLWNVPLAVYNLAYAVSHPGLWLDWSDPKAVMRVVYYGGSSEFFFVVLTALLVLTGFGLWRRSIMWGAVRALEGTANTIGRVAAWAGLAMVLQQVVIVFLQRVFRVAEISIGPFGYEVAKPLSWYAEELKFYNAIVVALCCGYTFVQGGHVRVDIVYSAIGHRARRVVDMAGALLFMMPATVLIWVYAWFFLWRHLIIPNPSASDTLERLLLKSRALRWNVETIAFSPQGFDGYFLFKLLLLAFTGLIFLQAVAVLYRSFLEYVEGPESAGRYLDRDSLGAGDGVREGTA